MRCTLSLCAKRFVVPIVSCDVIAVRCSHISLYALFVVRCVLHAIALCVMRYAMYAVHCAL